MHPQKWWVGPMADPFVKGHWIIVASLLMAMVLVLIPLPAAAPFELNYLRVMPSQYTALERLPSLSWKARVIETCFRCVMSQNRWIWWSETCW